MLHFYSKCASVFIFTGIVFCCLDLVYSWVYRRWGNSEVGVVARMNGMTHDVVFVGSSRTRHHYDIELLENLSGGTIRAYNLGITGGAGLPEMTAMLRRYLKNNRTRIVVVEAHEFGDRNPPQCFRKFLPWYFDDGLRGYFESYNKISFLGFPFVRYLLYPGFDWRYLGYSIISGKLEDPRRGFIPLSGRVLHMFEPRGIRLDFSDPRLGELGRIADESGVSVVFVVPPVWHGSVELLNQGEWQVMDLSAVVTDEWKFRDSLHLNQEGAEEFTETVWRELLFDPGSRNALVQ